jgi:2,3-bisphosphoglycerate-independent phosphoglycerate mutase
MRKKTILVITDGIGYSSKTEFNAFYNAKKPTYDYLFANVPYSLIHTYGLHVGLPDGQMGNSEVGHMTIGSGRVSYQDLVKVSLALSDGSLAKNEALNTLFDKSNTFHIAGLISDGGVHSHSEHIIGIAKLAKDKGKKVYIHAITDGRDVSPTSAKEYLKDIVDICDGENIILATLGGRFYTMDRDNRWSDRVRLGYEAISAASPKTSKNPLEYIDESYSAGVLDEFLVPVAFSGYDGLCENDSFLFANFRSDRAREIVTALGEKDFPHFDRDFKPINIATMTEYSKSFDYPILFSKDEMVNTLAEVISKAGLSQLHTSETEKYAHVTFFLNGGVETPCENETRVLIDSPKVRTYDEKPSMSAYEVCDAVLKGMDDGYDFVVVNFANGDMVGHTGVFEAGIKAVETVDECLGKIVAKSKERDYSLILTSDHGNCEEMKDDNGETLTNHTVGDVWCFVMDGEVKSVKAGSLNNIAPTVLRLMGVEIPAEMDEPLV